MEEASSSISCLPTLTVGLAHNHIFFERFFFWGGRGGEMTVLCFVVEGFCCRTWAGLDSWLSSSLSLWSSRITGMSQSTHILSSFCQHSWPKQDFFSTVNPFLIRDLFCSTVRQASWDHWGKAAPHNLIPSVCFSHPRAFQEKILLGFPKPAGMSPQAFSTSAASLRGRCAANISFLQPSCGQSSL